MITIPRILRPFGLTRCYKGYSQMVYCIELAAQNDLGPLSMTNGIYQEAAVHFNCSWKNIERNLRTAVSRAWEVNPELLCRIAGYPLKEQPSPSQFIEIITYYYICVSKRQ